MLYEVITRLVPAAPPPGRRRPARRRRSPPGAPCSSFSDWRHVTGPCLGFLLGRLIEAVHFIGQEDGLDPGAPAAFGHHLLFLDVVADLVAADLVVRLLDPGIAIRITSYNVCYTKLLRILIHMTLMSLSMADILPASPADGWPVVGLAVTNRGGSPATLAAGRGAPHTGYALL